VGRSKLGKVKREGEDRGTKGLEGRARDNDTTTGIALGFVFVSIFVPMVQLALSLK